MSIKPIDFHLTYANTVNESKNKQLDFNRVKESNQLAQHQQQVETEKSQKRINHAEESRGKSINNQPKNPQGKSKENDSKGEEEKEQNSEKSNSSSKFNDIRGSKIDIMI